MVNRPAVFYGRDSALRCPRGVQPRNACQPSLNPPAITRAGRRRRGIPTIIRLASKFPFLRRVYDYPAALGFLHERPSGIL